MIVVASLSAVPQSCRTPLPIKEVLHLFRCFTHTQLTFTHTHTNKSFTHNTHTQIYTYTYTYISHLDLHLVFSYWTSPSLSYPLEEVAMWGYPVLEFAVSTIFWEIEPINYIPPDQFFPRPEVAEDLHLELEQQARLFSGRYIVPRTNRWTSGPGGDQAMRLEAMVDLSAIHVGSMKYWGIICLLVAWSIELYWTIYWTMYWMNYRLFFVLTLGWVHHTIWNYIADYTVVSQKITEVPGSCTPGSTWGAEFVEFGEWNFL